MINKLVQSLLPVGAGPVLDAEGQPFARVLGNVAQLNAPTAASGWTFDYPSTHPHAKEAVLWVPISLRVRPVYIGGAEYALTVNMRPDLGWLAYSLQNRQFQNKFKGWKARMPISFEQALKGECSEAFPQCQGLGDVVEFHAPWIVDNVELVASGVALNQSANTMLRTLFNSYRPYTTMQDPSLGFDLISGVGSARFQSQVSEISFKATAKASATDMVQVSYAENSGVGSVKAYFQDLAAKHRILGSR